MTELIVNFVSIFIEIFGCFLYMIAGRILLPQMSLPGSLDDTSNTRFWRDIFLLALIIMIIVRGVYKA